MRRIHTISMSIRTKLHNIYGRMSVWFERSLSNNATRVRILPLFIWKIIGQDKRVHNEARLERTWKP